MVFRECFSIFRVCLDSVYSMSYILLSLLSTLYLDGGLQCVWESFKACLNYTRECYLDNA